MIDTIRDDYWNRCTGVWKVIYRTAGRPELNFASVDFSRYRATYRGAVKKPVQIGSNGPRDAYWGGKKICKRHGGRERLMKL